MKKILILIGFLYSINSFSQSTVLLRGDTIRIYKQGGDAVLKVDSTLIIDKFKQGNSNDSVLTWDPVSKKVRMMDRNSFGGGSAPTLQQVFDTEVGGSVLTKMDTINVGSSSTDWLRILGSGSTHVLQVINTGSGKAINGAALGAGTAIEGNATSGLALRGSTVSGTAVLELSTGASTGSDIVNVANFYAMSQSTNGSNGIGGQIIFGAESSTTVFPTAARLQWYYPNATHASRTTYMNWLAYNSGTEDTVMQIQPLGIIRVNNNADTLSTKAYARSVGGGGGGYTNLTQFVAQNNWKTFYSDGSGDVQELSLGAAGSPFYSTSTTGAPAFFGGVTYATSGANVIITAQNTTDTNLVLKGVSSQTAPLLAARNSAGTNVFSVSAAGAIYTPVTDDQVLVSDNGVISGGSQLTFTTSTNNILNIAGSNSNNVVSLVNLGGNSGQLFKTGGAYGSYKNITSGDLGFYNSTGSGNISVLNDYASGNINFAAGGSTTAQLTISASGLATFSNTVTASQGSSTYKLGGSLTVNTTDIGNVGVGEDDLMTYSVPAGLLAATGDFIEFTMSFDFASNASSKQVKVKFGATTIYASGAQTQNDGVIEITGKIIRTGAATQRITYSVSSNATLFTDYADYVTAGETLSGAITLKATGESVSNNDIVQHIMTVKFFPNN